MNVIKENVERIIADDELGKYEKLGFREIGSKIPKPSDETQGKKLSDLTVPELKKLAEEKGIEGFESLNKPELLKVLGE